MAFHDLTLSKPPFTNLRSLLGLSLKFIPTRRYSANWTHLEANTWPRFDRDLEIKVFMAGNFDPDRDYNPRMYVKSTWDVPPHLSSPDSVVRRRDNFKAALKPKFIKRRCPSNLLPHQQRALTYLRSQDDYLVVQCDKNLGPAIIEKSRYILMAYRDHLDDFHNYRFLTPAQAEHRMARVKRDLDHWISNATARGVLLKDEKKFLIHHFEDNKDPYPTFYLTMKVHKTPLKSRPIVSCSGSLLYALGVWVDHKLQIVAQKQRSYFKNSYALKQMLLELGPLPPHAKLFTADAVSMYTNIPTSKALARISLYLSRNYFRDVPVRELMAALRLVMENNLFKFGDTHWLQLSGTAMGTPPAPPYATLYFAILEDTLIPSYSQRNGNCLVLYKRFIDDVFGIWVPSDPTAHDATWERFKSALNDDWFELEWEVSDLSESVDFMDMTISIDAHRCITTTLYEKPSNLHLYIPPHSCHPPGLLQGIVFGMLFRIYTLCTDPADRTARTRLFFRRLQLRGYHADKLRPLFFHAIAKASAYTGPVPRNREITMFFHLQYHPKNPPSRVIQQAWADKVVKPTPHHTPFDQLRNRKDKKIGINRLTVAYSRAPNLSNLLSYRKLKTDNTGRPASWYRTHETSREL